MNEVDRSPVPNASDIAVTPTVKAIRRTRKIPTLG
jgi:hypothetical protein